MAAYLHFLGCPCIDCAHDWNASFRVNSREKYEVEFPKRGRCPQTSTRVRVSVYLGPPLKDKTTTSHKTNPQQTHMAPHVLHVIPVVLLMRRLCMTRCHFLSGDGAYTTKTMCTWLLVVVLVEHLLSCYKLVQVKPLDHMTNTMRVT